MRSRTPMARYSTIPDLIVACVVGDGEAETGPLATSWHSNKFLYAGQRRRRAADPSPQRLQDRQSDDPRAHRRGRIAKLFIGYGYKPYWVEGDDPAKMHQLMAGTLDRVFDEIRDIQSAARGGKREARPAWPMIMLKTPKGWTGPKEVDGLKTEGFWRSHQVPIADMTKPGHVRLLEEWMKSYRPAELFDDDRRAQSRHRSARARKASGA